MKRQERKKYVSYEKNTHSDICITLGQAQITEVQIISTYILVVSKRLLFKSYFL